MNLKKINKLLLVFALGAVLSACTVYNTKPENTAVSNEIDIKDMMGREVAIEKKPERIVALLPSDVEILYYIGAEDKIIAVGDYCNYPKEAPEEKKVVSTGAETNIEQIVALNPDLVIMGSMAQTKEQVSQLESAGIDVVVTNANNIEETYQDIELLGKISDREKEAEKLIEDMKNELAKLKEECGRMDYQQGIYFEVSPLEYGLWTGGKDTFMQELCNITNIKNIFDDVESWAQISEEEVIQRNPDVIVATSKENYSDKSPENDILKRAGWQDINAVKDNKILVFDDDSLVRPGPRLCDAAKKLASFVYGVEIK